MTSAKSWRDILPVHPAADLFPMLSDAELVTLGADIKARGILNKIVIWNGPGTTEFLLDGRNRLAAAEKAGLLEFDDGRLSNGWSTTMRNGASYASKSSSPL